MDELSHILARLVAVEAAVREVRELVEKIAAGRTVAAPAGTFADAQTQYEALYAEFVAVGPPAVERFVNGAAAEELRDFCLANELDLDQSRGRLAVVITRRMAEHRARQRRG